MGRYEREARHHLEGIEYYHKNAGTKAYSQAKYNYC